MARPRKTTTTTTEAIPDSEPMAAPSVSMSEPLVPEGLREWLDKPLEERPSFAIAIALLENKAAKFRSVDPERGEEYLSAAKALRELP